MTDDMANKSSANSVKSEDEPLEEIRENITIDEVGEAVQRLIDHPTSRLMLAQNIEIPSRQSIMLLEKEFRAFQNPDNSDLILQRLATRMGLDKLVASHNMVTNFLLMVLKALDVKLRYYSYPTYGDTVSRREEILEISIKGNYTDTQLADVTERGLVTVTSLQSALAKANRERDTLTRELAEEKAKVAEAKKQSDLEKGKLILNYATGERSTVIYLPVGENHLYLSYAKDDSEFYVDSDDISRAVRFKDASSAFAFYEKLVTQTRNYIIDNIHQYTVGQLTLQRTTWEVALTQGQILLLQNARSKAEDFEKSDKSLQNDIKIADEYAALEPDEKEEELSEDSIAKMWETEDQGTPKVEKPAAEIPKVESPKNNKIKPSTDISVKPQKERTKTGKTDLALMRKNLMSRIVKPR